MTLLQRRDIVTRLRAAGCVFAEDEARLLVSAGLEPADLAASVERRVSGEPLEHILGWVEFAGLRIAVEAGVFVPRRRTEFLVRQAVSVTTTTSTRAVVLDLCCGSGAVGVAVAVALDGAELHAGDIDPSAVHCARRNLPPVGGRVYEGDLFDALPRELIGRVDVLVANAPYVPTGDVRLLPPEARLHEARTALDGGPDGLDVVRRVAGGAPQWLAPRGHLLVECSAQQVAQVVEAYARSGLVPRVVQSRSDDSEATVVVGAMTDSRGKDG